MDIRSTAFIGMGALGMLYGTFLIDAGEKDVVYVMDSARIEKYRDTVFYKNDTPYRLPMVLADSAKQADLVFVAVKYSGLRSALEVMKNCIGEDTIIVSVMNGITSEEIIAERYGKKHMVYTVAQGMDAMKFENRLDFTVMGELRFGCREKCQEENVKALRRFFDRVKMPYTIDKDIIRRLWSKFMLNVGVNQTCMVYETNYGGCLKKGEANRTMISAMREVIAIAAAEEIKLGEDDINDYLRILGTLSPENVPSMRQDALRKNRSEAPMFAGAVIDIAKRHGICVPVNEFLYERIQEIEKEY